jgi:hypothetical protein
MNLKGIAAVLAVMLAVLLAAVLLGGTGKQEAPPPEKPFAFSLSVMDKALLDNDNGKSVRAAVDVDMLSQGSQNASIELITLSKPAAEGVYEITGYQSSDDKQAIMSVMRGRLSSYGIQISDLPIQAAFAKKGVVLVLPSDAMPDILASGNLTDLMDGNTVIFFGKPLSLLIDESGAQEMIGDSLYSILGVECDQNGVFTQKTGGPAVKVVGNATVLDYNQSTLVIYDDPSDAGAGDEMADLILREGWQDDLVTDDFNVSGYDGEKTTTLFSSPLASGTYYLRMLYSAFSYDANASGVEDLGGVSTMNGTLDIPEIAETGKPLDYAFELHGDYAYPVLYNLSMDFVKDGQVVDTESAIQVTMKTVALDSGTVFPNLTSGSYAVRLIDQEGNSHALAYMHIPEVRLSLVRIEGNDYIFFISVDGKPADSVSGSLTANGKDTFPLRTDNNGEATFPFSLESGATYTFTADINGEAASTRYLTPGAGPISLFSLVFLLGGGFLAALIIFRNKEERKRVIKTMPKLPLRQKTLKIPYLVFLDIFKKTQADRAPGLPLSLSDLRLGIRKHASYKGAPLFVTDSNIYGVLDAMVKKGKFDAFGGYYLPAEMASGRPIEHWVMRRMLTDRFLENGEKLKPVKEADYRINGRFVHLWGKAPNPKRLVSLCRKAGNLMIFPDEKRKQEFLRMVTRRDPYWMMLSLEVRHGRMECQTIDDFMGLRSDGTA